MIGASNIQFYLILLGILLVNLNQTDIAEARALSHRSDVIDVYSNSWGPPDDGYSVGKLGPLAELTFKQEAKEVYKPFTVSWNLSMRTPLR